MSSTPERTVSPPVEAPTTNKLVLQRLKFKARAPNGKIYTWSQRRKMDTVQQRLARSKVKDTPAFLMTTTQEQQEMLDAAVEECDEQRRKRGVHTSCMFLAYSIPILELRPEDLLVTPQKTASPVPPAPAKKIFKSTEKVSADDLLDESENENQSNVDDDNDEEEENDYLVSPTMTPGEKWAEIMHSSSSKKLRRKTFSSHSHQTVIPKPDSIPTPLISLTSLSAHSSTMLLSTSMPTSSLHRGVPLVIIDDEEDETTQDLHTEENPGLSSEWRKMLNM